VQVEIWSDVVCPWCYIGKRRFEQALEQFDGRDQIDVVFRPYQLDPTAPPGVATPVAEAYAKKFGGADQAERIIANVTNVAAESGLEFRMDRALRANTLLAHRLLWFAEQTSHAMQAAVKEQLLEAYFIDGEHIGSPEVLAERAAAAGLDRSEVEAFLASNAGHGEVMEQLAMAHAEGITAVPTFIFNGKWSVPGAQDVDTFLRVFERMVAIEREQSTLSDGSDESR
jgi:predicted DsbA family dithiol-disulfide isomerase